MNYKLLIALSCTLFSFSASSSVLLNIPLAKKCYAICQQLENILLTQKTDKCKNELKSAKNNTEIAALKISEDKRSDSKKSIENAIYALMHAEVYSCTNADDIILAEKALDKIYSEV